MEEEQSPGACGKEKLGGQHERRCTGICGSGQEQWGSGITEELGDFPDTPSKTSF